MFSTHHFIPSPSRHILPTVNKQIWYSKASASFNHLAFIAVKGIGSGSVGWPLAIRCLALSGHDDSKFAKEGRQSHHTAPRRELCVSSLKKRGGARPNRTLESCLLRLGQLIVRWIITQSDAAFDGCAVLSASLRTADILSFRCLVKKASMRIWKVLALVFYFLVSGQSCVRDGQGSLSAPVPLPPSDASYDSNLQ